eukprot:31566-Pelagococcus_subviridis.AAC.6
MLGAHRQQQALQKPVKHGGREGGGSGVGSSARGGRGRKRQRGERKEAACGRVGIYRGRAAGIAIAEARAEPGGPFRGHLVWISCGVTRA